MNGDACATERIGMMQVRFIIGSNNILDVSIGCKCITKQAILSLSNAFSINIYGFVVDGIVKKIKLADVPIGNYLYDNCSAIIICDHDYRPMSPLINMVTEIIVPEPIPRLLSMDDINSFKTCLYSDLDDKQKLANPEDQLSQETFLPEDKVICLPCDHIVMCTDETIDYFTTSQRNCPTCGVDIYSKLHYSDGSK